MLRYFPAAGLRSRADGISELRGEGGYYWSSTVASATYAWRLWIGASSTRLDVAARSAGMPVRCVAR